MTQKRTYLITFRTVGYGTAEVQASSQEEAEAIAAGFSCDEVSWEQDIEVTGIREEQR